MSDSTENNIMFSFWDGGKGHLARVHNLATEASARGHEVSFITSERYALELGSLATSDNIHVIPNRPASVPPPYEFPVYSHAFSNGQRLKGLGFDNPEWIAEITRREIEAIKKSRPDVIVNDYRDTIRTAAEVCDVPVVGVTQTTGNLAGYRLGSWLTPPVGVRLADCKDSFNEVRSDYGLVALSDELYMFNGDQNIIPSIPALDPLKSPSANSHYVGMISQWETGSEDFRPINTSGSNVYSYVGESSRPSFGYEDIMQDVIEAEPGLGFYVVGDPAKYDSPVVLAKQRQGSLSIEPFIPGSAAIADSSVVLTHGGHSTTCLALSLGKPVIGIGAYQTEAATTLRNVDAAGAGIYLPHSTGRLERRAAPDLGEDISMCGSWRTELTGEIVGQALFKVLENPSFAENAARLGSDLIAYGGVRRAMDIIEETARS